MVAVIKLFYIAGFPRRATRHLLFCTCLTLRKEREMNAGYRLESIRKKNRTVIIVYSVSRTQCKIVHLMQVRIIVFHPPLVCLHLWYVFRIPRYGTGQETLFWTVGVLPFLSPCCFGVLLPALSDYENITSPSQKQLT